MIALQNTYPAEIKSWRHVVYTCYQPRSMASQQDLEMKAEAYHKYQITTHLPAQNIRVYNEDFAKCKTMLCVHDLTAQYIVCLSAIVSDALID